MSNQIISDQAEASTLVRTLSTVANQIEPSSDWDRLLADIAQGEGNESAKPVFKRPRLLAAAAAVVAIGAGGVALTTISGPSPNEISATKPNYVLPGEIVLSQDPLIVTGAPGPPPEFDTSDLGRQILFEPVHTVNDELDQTISRTISMVMFSEESRTATKVTIVGHIEGEPWFIIVTDGPNIDGVGGLPVDRNFRQRFVGGPSGGSAGGDIVPIASLELIESPVPVTSGYTLPFGYTFPDGWVELSQLPVGTSVVSFSDDDSDLWLIPSAGVAAFPAEFEEGERFHLQAFDAEGELIASVSQIATSGG